MRIVHKEENSFVPSCIIHLWAIATQQQPIIGA